MSNFVTNHVQINSTTAETAESATAGELAERLGRQFDVVRHEIVVGGRTFQLQHPRSADELIDEAAFNIDERLPYWAEVWPSAFVLAERLMKQADGNATLNHDPADEKPRLLELGCGCGLAALAALAASYAVTAIDYYAEALEFVRLNALLNGLPLPETRVVDWRSYPTDLNDFDVVTAADVLYEREYTRLVAAAFRQSLKPGGLGILTDPQRSKAEAFPGHCREFGLQIEPPKVFGPLNVPGGDPAVRQTVNLFEIRRVAG